jgi:hypothetical protein
MPYIPLMRGPLSNFSGPFGGPKMESKKQQKNDCFLVVSDHFSLTNNLVMGLLLSLAIGPYILPTCGPLFTFLGPFGGAQLAPKWKKIE